MIRGGQRRPSLSSASSVSTKSSTVRPLYPLFTRESGLIEVYNASESKSIILMSLWMDGWMMVRFVEAKEGLVRHRACMRIQRLYRGYKIRLRYKGIFADLRLMSQRVQVGT